MFSIKKFYIFIPSFASCRILCNKYHLKVHPLACINTLQTPRIHHFLNVFRTLLVDHLDHLVSIQIWRLCKNVDVLISLFIYVNFNSGRQLNFTFKALCFKGLLGCRYITVGSVVVFMIAVWWTICLT